jgi:SEC-C motif-containing protein
VGVTCPCGRTRAYDDCCGAIHAGRCAAATAEDLMRSRYTAFVMGDARWLASSWDPATAPDRIRLDPDQRWTGLEVLLTRAGGMLDQTGVVEFRAHRERSGRPGIVQERSRFTRHDGRWAYWGPDDASR